jgi:long-chain acyl-CoA synthetase
MTLHEAGEHPAAIAGTDPDRPAVVMVGSGETRTYRQLDEASRRLALVFRDRGLRPGDHLAVLLDNQPAYFDAVWAGLRSGLYVTPINWHLTADEAAFIVADCGADALVAGAGLAPVLTGLGDRLDDIGVRLAVGGTAPGFEPYEPTVSHRPLEQVADECEGQWMFYSSGTTGRPKGIVPGPVGAPLGAPSAFTMLLTGLFGFSRDTVYLSPAPLYHAAPAGWTTGTQRIGGTVVVMEHFDPEHYLALIERHRITHTQLVPTMFSRMLKMPEAVRNRYDTSSLEFVVHAAAPCPIPVKEQMIDWWGPIIHEYYGATEGLGFTACDTAEWLAHRGTVGRVLLGDLHVLGADMQPVPQGQPGELWFKTASPFVYFNDPERTQASRSADGTMTTVGDIGYVDSDGYVHLTDRSTFMIISGGLNIYPQECENLLITHPKVLDAAVFGVPNEDLGEEVKAVVQPLPGIAADAAFAAELIAFCREHLAHPKCPRSIDFTDALPRLPTGKLYKKPLRDAYWRGDGGSRII